MDLQQLTTLPDWQWPENSGAIIQQALASPDSDLETRVQAAHMGSTIVTMNDALAEVYLGIICNSEEPETLRGAAAIALGPALEEVDFAIDEFDDDNCISVAMGKRIQQRFKEIFDEETEPKLVRRRVLEASIRFQRGWHADAVRFAWASEDAEWRLTAVFCMGCVRGFQKQIVEALKDPEPQVVAEAIRAAGNWELKEGRALVKSVLTAANPAKTQLFAALQAAASVIPTDQARSFLKRFKRHPDQEVREVAAEALEELEIFDCAEDDELW